MIDYRIKIQKLLALAESNNENEAKAALLKAKELMMEHKLSEDDFRKANTTVETIITDYSYTKRGEFWIGNLATIIADNYSCRAAGLKMANAQKRTVEFVGLKDDVELCNVIFSYAVDTARQLSKRHLKETGARYNKNRIKNSYALGFCEGIRTAYINQKNDHKEWGLVAVRPKEVDEECSQQGFRRDNYRSKIIVNAISRSEGFEEGKKFNPQRVLT